MKTISVCGVTYTVKEQKYYSTTLQYGAVDYGTAEISINKELSNDVKAETLCHELVHAILRHLGYLEQACDEQFVQALGNAVYQTFVPKAKSVMMSDAEE